MAMLLSLSVDVTKIDKQKLINGKKGTYLNLTVSVNDREDQYGNNVACWQSQTREEREAGEKRNYLGNGRVVWSGNSQPRQQSQHERDKANGYQPDPDTLPF